MKVSDVILSQARDIAGAINQNIASYGLIAGPFKIKGQCIGILHHMEAGGDFSCHLANGDPLSSDTVHDPSGIMAKYGPDKVPPYDFIEAGIAALKDYSDGWGAIHVVDVPTMLNFFCCYNGNGPWNHPDANGNPQLAYLFASSSEYVGGKFTLDGVWDAQAVSKQIGAAVIMKALNL